MARIGGLGMQRVCSTTLLAEEAGPARRPAQGKWRQFIVPLLAAAPLGAVALSTAIALELPKPEPLREISWQGGYRRKLHTVKPTVRSDGVMRIFDVDTPYGKFAFDGVELRRSAGCTNSMQIAAIEKMSQSNEFGKAFGRAALGPIKFGADLVTNPADTVQRSLSGIGNMFDRVGAGLSNSRADRDQVMDSLLWSKRRAARLRGVTGR